MKIIVFGATGGTGSNVVACALAAGHDVVAVARKPEAIAARDRLVVHQGDVLDAASIAAAFAGADAVISAIGPTSNRRPGTLLSQGLKNIVAGCAQSGVRRLIFESGLIIGDGSELTFFPRLGLRIFRRIYHELHTDKSIAEAVVKGSALDWVIVRPPNLDHSAATGRYVAGPGARISLGRALSHADCAAVLLKAATGPQWVREVINVGRA